MPDQAEFAGVDFGSGLEEIQGSLCIGCKVEGCCSGKFAFRLAHAPVIAAENGNAFAGKIIGQQEEGLMPHQFFIPVLRTRASDQHDRRKFFTIPGKCKGPCQCDPGFFVTYTHIFGQIRKRRLGFLGTSPFKGFLFMFKVQWEVKPALFPSALKF